MPLKTLLIKLIDFIAQNLTSHADLSALSRTSCHLYQILDRRLYANDVRRGSNKALLFSTKKRCCSVLEKTIQGGVEDLNGLNRWLSADRLTTPLAFAAGRCHVEILKLLLKYGAHPSPDRWKEIHHTPSSAAAGGGYFEIVKILIEADADVHATLDEDCGSLALCAAAGCDNQYYDLVRLLLNTGVLDELPLEYRGTFVPEQAIRRKSFHGKASSPSRRQSGLQGP